MLIRKLFCQVQTKLFPVAVPSIASVYSVMDVAHFVFMLNLSIKLYTSTAANIIMKDFDLLNLKY